MVIYFFNVLPVEPQTCLGGAQGWPQTVTVQANAFSGAAYSMLPTGVVFDLFFIAEMLQAAKPAWSQTMDSTHNILLLR